MNLITKLKSWLILVLVALSFSYYIPSSYAQEEGPYYVAAYCEKEEDVYKILNLISNDSEYVGFILNPNNTCYDYRIFNDLGVISIRHRDVDSDYKPKFVKNIIKDYMFVIYSIKLDGDIVYSWNRGNNGKPLDNI
jgi:hypothetical protein